MLERMTRGKILWESDSAVKTEISPLTSDPSCGDISLVPDVLAVTQKIGWSLFLASTFRYSTLERMTRGKVQWESDSAVKTGISPLTSDSPCGDIFPRPSRAGSDATD